MNGPLTPPDADLRDFHFMPLDVARLINSDLAAIATGDEFRAAVILWCKSWHQVPAASLPNDDRMLAHLAGYSRDMKGWAKVREVALKGFVLCSDGRLYHPVVAEKAREAFEAKLAQRKRTEAATAARLAKKQARDETHGDATHEARDVQRKEQRDEARDEKRDVPRNEERDETRNVHQGTGTGTGTDIRGDRLTRGRDPDAELEAKLRVAAGWDNHPNPKLAVTGPIVALLDSGADLDLDVIPVIRALAPKVRSPSWAYFVNPIAEARDRRINAATVVSLPTSNPRTPHAAHRQKPSRDESFEAIDRRIEQLAEAERRAAGGGAGHAQEPPEGAA